MKSPAFIAVMALTSTLMACGDRDTPVQTGASGTAATTSTAQSAPAAPAMRDSTAAATPSTHAGAPQTPAPTAAAPAAQDTKAQEPLKDLTKAEEANSMPKPGQANNYSTTALDDANKGAANSSDGTKAGAAADKEKSAPPAK